MIAAVSGGPDSVALACLLHDLQRPAGFTLAGIAHFNHKLRGRDADEDEAFCRAFAERLSVPFLSESADVAEAARTLGTSVEDAGRRLRYGFLDRARIQANADLVAVAHTREDQAETFLLRLLRGAGARGLGGIRQRRGAVIRPLLDFGREELHAWLRERDAPFRVDRTNEDVTYPRNRIRHHVLPVLRQISPGAAETIARAARLALEDEDFLESRAIEVASSVVLTTEGSEVRLDAGRLRDVHPAVARRLLRQVLGRVAPGRFVAAEHLESLLRLEAGSLDLPGVVAKRTGTVLTLSPADGRQGGSDSESNVFEYPLSIPGEAQVPESGIAISAVVVIGWTRPAETTDEQAVSASAVDFDGGLSVRNRRPGDRLRPLGMTGSKKLQDVLVDRKVPQNERDRVPLVVDRRGRIVWVVGHTIAEDFRVTDPEGPVLLFKVRHFGGSV